MTGRHLAQVNVGTMRAAELWLLDRYGPSYQAFTFKARFPAPGTPGAPVDMNPDPWCVGRA